MIHEDSAALDSADDEETEVHGSETERFGLVSFQVESRRSMYESTYSMFCGRMTKHHLVQMEPVAIRAKFCVKDNFSAGRRKSEAPARTTPHFMIGALLKKQSVSE